MMPLCLPHHLSHNSETTNHATAKGELIMFESPILYILVITRKKKRTVCVLGDWRAQQFYRGLTESRPPVLHV